MTTSRGSGARRPALLLPALVLAGGLLLSGCGGSDDSSGGTASSDSGGSLSDAAEPASAARVAADGAAFSTNGSNAGPVEDAPGSQAQQRSVISTGSVELTADDVADARLDVLRVMSRYGGEVTDEQTATDPNAPDTSVSSPGRAVPEGSVPDSSAASDEQAPVTHTRLVLRVPSASFDRAMRDLAGIGHFVTSNRQSTDVTTQVIDVAARLQAQRRSVARVEQLLDRAESIREIVLVEGQLTRRQSQLESLERQHAYLQSQTSLATITVDVDQRTTAERRAAEQDSNFLSGLDAGWRGLTALVGGVLTSLGVLLPFLLLALPVGLALWYLRRRAARRPAGIVREDVAAE